VAGSGYADDSLLNLRKQALSSRYRLRPSLHRQQRTGTEGKHLGELQNPMNAALNEGA
jgi:hypothetical protein